MTSQPLNYLPGGVQLLGTTRCSEASPQCLSVGRNSDGDLVLANHRGEVLTATSVEFVEAVEIALFGDRT